MKDCGDVKDFLHAGSDSPKNVPSRPFFSIGVTTYNRRELLKQTLSSITEQRFSDFESIVGNDYTQETLSAGLLDIPDKRIRFVNHTRNLGELDNMNSLLELSRGRYFTWQFDDDLYAADFLQAVYDVLVEYNFPQCVFTSYEVIQGTSFPDKASSISRKAQLFTGPQFLRLYVQGKLKAMGCTGVYDAEYLRQIGGAERLCDGPIAIYSEYLLLIRVGLLEKVAYIDAPLVLYRSHEQSRGYSNTVLDQWRQAGEGLICKSIDILKSPQLYGDFHDSLFSILKLTLHRLVWKTLQVSGYVQARPIYSYLFSLKRHLNSLKGSDLYWTSQSSLWKAGIWVIWLIALAKFKSKAPHCLVKLAMKTQAFFVRSRFFRSSN